MQQYCSEEFAFYVQYVLETEDWKTAPRVEFYIYMQ